jgi:hypothetical protein
MKKIKKQTSVTPERSETPTSQMRYLSLYKRNRSHCNSAEENVKTTTSNVRKVRNIRIARPLFLWHERYSLHYKTTGKNQKQQSPRPPCPPTPPSPAGRSGSRGSKPTRSNFEFQTLNFELQFALCILHSVICTEVLKIPYQVHLTPQPLLLPHRDTTLIPSCLNKATVTPFPFTDLPFLLIHPHPQEGLLFFIQAFFILNFLAIESEANAPRRRKGVMSFPFLKRTKSVPKRTSFPSPHLISTGSRGIESPPNISGQIGTAFCIRTSFSSRSSFTLVPSYRQGMPQRQAETRYLILLLIKNSTSPTISPSP